MTTITPTKEEENDMLFVSDEHMRFFEDNVFITANGRDYSALVYTIGIDETCRKHFSDIYNCKYNRINPNTIYEGWQTGASRAITRLAFHLFSWGIVPGDDPNNYCPKFLYYNLDESHRQGVTMALQYFA